jgi:hypothetical protein
VPASTNLLVSFLTALLTISLCFEATGKATKYVLGANQLSLNDNNGQLVKPAYHHQPGR